MPRAQDRAKIVEKIAKLKQQSVAGVNGVMEDEALAFAAMMSRLMSEHAILEHEIRSATSSEEVDEKLVRMYTNGLVPRGGKRWEPSKTRVEWMERLARVVATAHFCRNVVTPGSARQMFVGREGDAEMAKTVFMYLAELAANFADKAYHRAYAAHKRGEAGWLPGYHRSFLIGFCERLGQRYDQEVERMKAEWAKHGTALVRLNDGLVKVNEFIKDKTNGFRKAGSVGGGDFNPDAAEEGREAADRLKLKGEAAELGSGAKAIEGRR